MQDNAKVVVGGRELELAPLKTGQIKRHWAKLAQVVKVMQEAEGAGVMEHMAEMVDAQEQILLASLQNRYQDVTLEQIEDMEFTDLQDAVAAVIGITGLTRKSKGEATPQAPANA